jgi:hypothetical protein
MYVTSKNQINTTVEITAAQARNLAEAIEQADNLARDLLAMQGSDDPNVALAGALRRQHQGDYSDDGTHPEAVLCVLVSEFGVEKALTWTRRTACTNHPLEENLKWQPSSQELT